MAQTGQAAKAVKKKADTLPKVSAQKLLKDAAINTAMIIGPGKFLKAGKIVSKGAQVIKSVTAKEAKEVAKATVGKYPPSGPPRAIVKRGTGLSPREAKVVSTKQPVTRSSGRSSTKEELEEKIATERSTRLRNVLTPRKSNSVKKVGPEKLSANKRPTVLVVRVKSPEQAKVVARAKVNIPADRKLDTSRKTAMKAAEEARSKKSAFQRELEQRPDPRGELGFSRRSSTAPDKDMIEANRRVNEGLREIKARERALQAAKRNSSRGRTSISKRVTTRKKLSKTRPLGK